jgi:putative heme-binding domain-containing protein
VRLRQARVPEIDKKLAELTRGLPAVDARLQQLFNQRRKSFLAASADAAAGAKVFAKHCAACHQIANQGAKIGPQLDGIGLRGLDRLLEDILDPNRNVDQAFRMTVLTLKNGQLANGLFLRQDGEVYVLADLTGKEVRVSRKEVEERATAPLSPMPANFVDQVSERDFHDLLAYLLAQRAAK